jgi:hypothetical protein
MGRKRLKEKAGHERDSIVLSDIYKRYPYKTYNVHSTTVPFPYFNKNEITSHKFSLTYAIWKKILVCYFKHIYNQLYLGHEFEIPNQIGSLRFLKRKRKNPKVDWVKTNKEFKEENLSLPKGQKKTAFFPMTGVFGRYVVILKWMRTGTPLKYKWMWRFSPALTKMKTYGKVLNKDTSLINRLNDV